MADNTYAKEIWTDLGFCGCYVGEGLLPKIKETLELCHQDNWGGELDDLTVFMLYWLHSQRFTDHGTTIRCSWRTEKGDNLLARFSDD